MDHHYRIIDDPVSLRCKSETVARTFRHILGGFFDPSPTDTPPPYVIGQTQDRYRVIHQDCLVGEYQDLSTLTTHLEWRLHHQALSHMSEQGLHAGAVVKDNRVLLLPGHSGTGKTTLVLGLLLSGWALLSDEIALIHPQTGYIRPFPRVLCVKHESLKLFGALDRLHGLEKPGAVVRLNEVDCVSPVPFPIHPEVDFHNTPLIIFSHYQVDAQPRLEEISAAHALGRLIRYTLDGHPLTQQGLDSLGGLVEHARCFDLQAGHLLPTLDLIFEQWLQPR